MFKKNAYTALQADPENRNNAIIQSEKLFSLSTGSEDFFRKMFFSSPIPAFLFKKSGGNIALADCSMAAVSLITMNKTSSCLSDIEPAIEFFTDKPEILSDISRCFSENASFARELPYSQNDSDQRRYFRFTYTLLKANLLLVYVEEISEKSLVISALREKQERLELALYVTDSALWDWNIASGELLINDKWATMLNYHPHEIKKHIVTWEKMLHPEDNSRVIESLRLHLKGQSDSYQDEHRLLRKNGDWIWVLDTGKITARDPNGYPTRAIGTKIDISKRKEMEQALHLHNHNLTKQVKEKTDELVYQELLLRKNLQKAKKQSHEIEKLNNALNKIIKDTDKIENNVKSNINEIVIPYLDTIENTSTGDGQKIYIDILRSNLSNIASPISRKLNSLHQNLTPTEIKVSDFIRHGKSTKQISDLMYVSIKTVKTHRRNIRKKLGLNGKKTNLIAYFRSIR
jgi:PAS domain S-box-containing protein